MDAGLQTRLQLGIYCWKYFSGNLELPAMLHALVHRGHAAPRILGVAALQVPQYGNKGSLHLTMDPLDKEYEGVFQISLTRPDARNAIGIGKTSTKGLCNCTS